MLGTADWAGEVPIKTMSRFDQLENVSAHRLVAVTGIAFAGRRGIMKVEVSLDDGRTWLLCELVTGEKLHVWSLWRYVWGKPTAGHHTLQVRATDGTGQLQTARLTDTFSNGASGLSSGQDSRAIGVAGSAFTQR